MSATVSRFSFRHIPSGMILDDSQIKLLDEFQSVIRVFSVIFCLLHGAVHGERKRNETVR